MILKKNRKTNLKKQPNLKAQDYNFVSPPR